MWEDLKLRLEETWELHKSLVLALVVIGIAAAIGVGVASSRSRVSKPMPAKPTAGHESAVSQNAPTEVYEFERQIATSAEKGDWSSVADLADEVRSRRSEQGFDVLDRDLATALKVDCQAHFIPRARQSSAGPLKLSRGDEYWLYVSISSRCYLYVLERSSTGRLKLIFPEPEFSSLSNPVDNDLRLPESYSVNLRVDDSQPGTYTLYILASVWQQKRLETLISGGLQPNETEISALLQAAEQETSRVPGLAFAAYQLQYEVAPRVPEQESI